MFWDPKFGGQKAVYSRRCNPVPFRWTLSIFINHGCRLSTKKFCTNLQHSPIYSFDHSTVLPTLSTNPQIMYVSPHLILLSLPLLTLANPLPAESTPDHDTKYFYPIHSSDPAYLLEKRAITRPLTGSNVRYRKCPSTDANRCPGIGESGPAGTKVAFVCYTLGSKVGGLLVRGKVPFLGDFLLVFRTRPGFWYLSPFSSFILW